MPSKYPNAYEAAQMEAASYSAVGGKKSAKKYKGGMAELMPGVFKGFAGCANWARGGGRGKSRKLRKSGKKGGYLGSSSSRVLSGNVSYEGYNLSGGRKQVRKTQRHRKSRRH